VRRLDTVILPMIDVAFVPTYEYECKTCPRVFEVRQRISEPALTTCDQCGGPIHRLLSPAPFILKGGGWYVTDYPSEARKKAQSSETGTGASTGSDAKTGTTGSASTGGPGGSESGSGSPKDSGGSKEPTKSPSASGSS